MLDRYGRLRARLTGELGPDELAHALAEGTLLGLEAAIEEAREALQD